MKKVIKEVNVKEVKLDDVSKDKFYGIKQGGSKGFISREGYDQGNFKAYCVYQLTNGNCWWIEKPTNCIIKFINYYLEKNYEVFEFDSSKDLCKWLAE